MAKRLAKKQKTFAKAYDMILALPVSKVTAAEKIMLLELGRYEEGSGKYFASNSTIANRLGHGGRNQARNIERAISNLVSKKLILRAYGHNDNPVNPKSQRVIKINFERIQKINDEAMEQSAKKITPVENDSIENDTDKFVGTGQVGAVTDKDAGGTTDKNVGTLPSKMSVGYRQVSHPIRNIKERYNKGEFRKRIAKPFPLPAVGQSKASLEQRRAMLLRQAKQIREDST